MSCREAGREVGRGLEGREEEGKGEWQLVLAGCSFIIRALSFCKYYWLLNVAPGLYIFPK